MTFHVDGVSRYITPNPYGYDEAALAEKCRVLKELAQLYPYVNPLWREWVYDVCVNTPPDQLEEMKRRVSVNPGVGSVRETAASGGEVGRVCRVRHGDAGASARERSASECLD